jgi:hypothetical protein
MEVEAVAFGELFLRSRCALPRGRRLPWHRPSSRLPTMRLELSAILRWKIGFSHSSSLKTLQLSPSAPIYACTPATERPRGQDQPRGAAGRGSRACARGAGRRGEYVTFSAAMQAAWYAKGPAPTWRSPTWPRSCYPCASTRRCARAEPPHAGLPWSRAASREPHPPPTPTAAAGEASAGQDRPGRRDPGTRLRPRAPG